MAMLYELVLMRTVDGEERQEEEASSYSVPERLRHGDVFVPGERVRVSLHVTAAGDSTEKGSRRLRMQWVAEVGPGSKLDSSNSSSSSSNNNSNNNSSSRNSSSSSSSDKSSQSSNHGSFYSSKESPTTIQACPKEGVMRAVPEEGEDFVTWELPSQAEGGVERGGGQEATIRVAFAARYGTVYLTEGLTLWRRNVGKRNSSMSEGGKGGRKEGERQEL